MKVVNISRATSGTSLQYIIEAEQVHKSSLSYNGYRRIWILDANGAKHKKQRCPNPKRTQTDLHWYHMATI